MDMIERIMWNYKFDHEKASHLISQAGTTDYNQIKSSVYPIYQIIYIDLWQ